MEVNCMFCDYKETVRKQQTIYEDEDYAAFLSNRPISKGHSILIPKNHIESFSEVLDAKGLLILTETIADGITNMSYLHVHLIPMFGYPEGKVLIISNLRLKKWMR